MNVDVHPDAVQALMTGLECEAEILRLGKLVAEQAKSDAPKRTGKGAASIHAEIEHDAHGVPFARVSWDVAHFYMLFAEIGTRHERARPFLRPALAAIKRP